MEKKLSALTPYELGEMGVAEAVPYIGKFLKSAKTQEIQHALSALGKIAKKHPDACLPLAPDIIKFLHGDQGNILRSAVAALSKIPITLDEETRALLHSLAINHPIQSTRTQAGNLSRTIGRFTPKPTESNTVFSAPPAPVQTLNLTGEQRRILTLPPSNPVLIKGVAGSGKTTIAIIRAIHLAGTAEDLFRETQIHVFAYTKTLANYITSILDKDAWRHSTKISVSTLHSWCWTFLNEAGIFGTKKVTDSKMPETIIRSLVAKHSAANPDNKIFQKPLAFFTDEIHWMKGSRIFDKKTYLELPRQGRGLPLTEVERNALWGVYLNYWQELKALNLLDFDDLILQSLKLIEHKQDFVPPFSHIVVDEAQDMSAADMQLISKLVNPETKSLTLIADSAQRIYKSGFTWKSAGINLPGARSFELKRNYRNTKQISEAAASLLYKDPSKEEFTNPIHPEKEGPLPVLIYTDTIDNQISHIAKIIKDKGLLSQSVFILHRTLAGCLTIQKKLQQHDFFSISIQVKTIKRITNAGIYVCPMKSAKGLEADHIIISDVNDNLLPLSAGFTGESDDLHISVERRLLYTCMTRAKESLTLITTHPPSRFLSEIDPQKIECKK